MPTRWLALVPGQLDAATESKLASRAERIRELVNVARGCIIEIGRELDLARQEIERGQWCAWLCASFGWSEKTAYNYINVSRSFVTSTNSLGLAIDTSALILLAKPDVPQRAREEAIQRAEAGERISLAEAEKLVIARVAEAMTARPNHQNLLM